MSKILAAVGGTGQEIALACLRLSHMAGLEIPLVFVFDSDSDDHRPEVTDTETRSEALKELGKFIALYAGRDPLNFVEPIEHEQHTRDIQSLFSPFNKTPQAVSDILALLTTAKQRETLITEGFHGQPQVGAIAFTDAVRAGRLDGFMAALDEATAAPGVAHSVVIVGGAAGGTGPGVMPVLARRLEQWRSGLIGGRKQQIAISVVVHLPWFQLVNASPTDIDVDGMERNSTCLVRFYSEELAKLADRVVLLALPEMITRISNGPHHQPETLHYLNAFSGWLAAELLTESATRKSMAQQDLYGTAFTNDIQITELALTRDKSTATVSLKKVLDTTRLMVGCGEELKIQLSHPHDLALPWEMRALAARIGEGLGRFVNRFYKLTDADRSMLEWLRKACLSSVNNGGGRDRNDQQGLFRLSPGATETSSGALARIGAGLSPQRHVLVAQLIGALQEDLFSVLDGPAEPEIRAASLYRALRASLLRNL